MIYLFLIVIMSMASNCSKDKVLKDDELSIQKIPFTGNQLRIDGYYYNKYGSPEKLTIYFYYRNEIILLAGDAYEMSKMNEFEQTFLSNGFIEKRREIKYCWGVFNIEENNIKFERWYPSEPPLKAYVRAGTILNDTTFLITESYRMQDGQKTEVDSENETYHFKAFSPKPDSTNSFVN